MSELVPIAEAPPVSTPVEATLPSGAPSLEQLLAFARDAERRFASLRMRIRETVYSARGEEGFRHEVLMRHPGWARVTRHRGDDPLSRDYVVWVSDGRTVQTYDAADRRATRRPVASRLVGAERADLPDHSRTRPVLTALPANSLADAFVHPCGLLDHVLASGPLALLGTASIAGREAYVVRSDHPRTTLILTDRPDRQVEVGVDAQTGLVLLLVERIGDDVTRSAQVTDLVLDDAIPDEAFELHLGSGVRTIY